VTVTGLDVARTAAADGAWTQALAALPESSRDDPEALEIRAAALYALGDLEGCLTAWERMHARCAASGDPIGAARGAVMTALHLLIDTGLMAPVRGWVARAERLLDGAPTGPVHALIAMVRTYERFLTGDLAACRAFAAEAIELGELYDVTSAAVIGQVAQARLLVLDGRIDDGLRALDEAGARLMSGDIDPLTTGMMLCEIVCAAQALGLHELAREWTDVMDRWGQRSAVGGIHGRCRVHRAELLRISGTGAEAETEALAACAELQPWMRREYGWPLVELGTIRLRRGDLAGAEDAFLQADALAWPPQPGLALLRLAQGRIETAMELIADAVAHPPEIPWKERPPSGDLRLVPLLDAQSEIAAAAGDARTCAHASAELARIARAYPSRSLEALAALAEARAALLAGDLECARELGSAAAQAWGELGAPYERAVVGDAAAAAGHHEAARREWQAASRCFADYGAARRAGELDDRLAEPSRPVRATAREVHFRRHGALRVVAFSTPAVTVPDLVGYRYLELLLARPGDEISCLDLIAHENGGVRSTQLGLPALDDEARECYRRRLLDVEEDIATATAMNDLGRVELAERDKDFLVAELARAVGFGGRIRQVGSDAERARTSVYRALRYAIKQLAVVDPTLGQHVSRSVRTGSWCSYAPDPLAPLTWRT
jgi:tetratricopeptide (TPR) repeat protein